MTKKQIREDELKELRKNLKKLLKPGDKVGTVLNHVSRSGMMREISCYIARKNKIVNITWSVANILGMKRGDTGGIRTGGCGMDMGFDIVYSLGSVLWPKGFKCAGENCRSNDHFNDHTCDRVKGKHHHNSGGYALEHNWI